MKILRILSLFALSLVMLAGTLAPAAAQTGCLTYHTVRSGENLYRVGLQYNLTWDVIASANGLTNPNRVVAGQVLCIPAGGVAVGGPVGAPPSTGDVIGNAGSPNVRTITVARDTTNNTISLNAAGFPPNARYDVYIASNTTDFSRIVFTGMTDAQGRIVVTFPQPTLNAAPLQYVTVVGTQGNWGRATFTR